MSASREPPPPGSSTSTLSSGAAGRDSLRAPMDASVGASG